MNRPFFPRHTVARSRHTFRLASPVLAVLTWIVGGSLSDPAVADEHTTDADVVIYGGTSAAIAAAVQVARMERSVVVVSPDLHLGGLSSGGLGWTDSGRKEAIGGISREFYQRLKAHYDRPDAWRQQKPAEYSRYRPDDDAMWVFEPHAAEAVFEAFVRDYELDVRRGKRLEREGGVRVEEGRIISMRTLDGDLFRGKIFIDATYEGDLMAAAGVPYHVGRESNETYGETLNGIQITRAVKHQFESKIDPYVVPGDPSSGLLPRISPDPPGKEGEGDHRVQAYNFRVCLTDAPENRLPFPKPEGYDPAQYELLLRTLEAGSRHIFGKFDPAPNRKTDTNNHGPFSTDNIGMNYAYPEASYEEREAIVLEHETYQKGYFYFLANDPRVPEDVRTRMSRWGLARDEFLDNGHWPHQIYVREARRMVSDFVMSERHLRGLEPTPRSIGMGSYNMDSHNTQRYVAHDENGQAYVLNEGDIQVSPGGPYPISYDAIVPPAESCENLLVPVALSSSHIAYGSIRMEPVFMILGQSAATAACLALSEQGVVQDVAYADLERELLADGQVLRWERPGVVALSSLSGIVLDNEAAVLIGEWSSSSVNGPRVGSNYLHDGNSAKGDKSAVFETPLPESGRYRVLLAYPPNANRATNVPVHIRHAAGETAVEVNQRHAPTVDKAFVELGVWEFASGETARVTVKTAGTDGHVIVDAVRFVPVP